MRSALAGLILLFASLSPALAQTTFKMPPPAGTVVLGVQVVTSCGAANITVPAIAYLVMDHTGVLCTSSSGSGGGGLSVPFGGAIGANGTPGGFKDSTGNFQPLIGNTAALGQYVDTSPSSNLAAILNSPVPCKAAATWNASTGLTGTNPVGCDGSAALWGDVGAVGGTVVGTYGTAPVAVPAVPVNAAITQLPATPAGTNVIGKVGIDQTTPGTTNGVQVNAALPAGTNTIGAVNQGTSPWVISGALTANQSVNVAQFGGSSTATGQVAVSVAPVTATNTALVVDLRPDSPGIITLGPANVAQSVPQTISSQYPTNATTTTPTAVTATATGTTAATAATLAATASVTNYVCGFDISAAATSLTTGTATLSGTISGSMAYIQTVQAVASGASILTRTFNPCIPASAANTAITITSAAAGTLGNTIVNIWGYRL